jgi:hypothetical protein
VAEWKKPMHKVSIADLRRLVERADILLQREFKALSSHWNADKQGFHTNRETRAEGRINVTTTCFGLFAILRNEELLDRFFAKPDKKAEATALDGVAKTLASIPWTSEKLDNFNIYTTPIVIQTLYQLIGDRIHGTSVKGVLNEKESRRQIRQGVETIITETRTHGAARFPPYESNAYLTYWCFEALRRETEQKLFDPGLQEQCRQQVVSLAMWGEAELHRQIAYYAARDMALFDPIQLAYALRIYTGYRTWISQPVNQKLVAKTVEIVFEHQEQDGLWPKSRPIFHFSTRGSVYPFTFEMLDVLLPNKTESALFEPYIGKLAASLRWAEDNYIDGAKEKGWRGNHLPYGTDPEGWSTAAVLIAVRKIRGVVIGQINDDLLDDFRAQRNDASDESALNPENFYDAQIPGKASLTLKGVLKKYLIDPHKPGGTETDRRYSAVFFGPPGTAKTTLASAVAKALGWPYIYLQTSDFAGEGVNQIIGKARAIFDRLSLLEKAVVLFDEVEEFVRDRTKEVNPSSRMLTTSMLSLIQELRSKKGVIFIVATNFLDKFDAAIARSGGRFDMMVLISPPSREEKKRLFRERLAKKLPPAKAEKLYGQIDKYVDSRFDKVFSLFAYSEWKLMVDAFIDDILDKEKMDEASLDAIKDDRVAVIALNDPELQKAYAESGKYIRL